MFEKLIKKITKAERVSGKINLVLVDDRAIKELNRMFRHKDKATDVLSFPMNEDGIIGDIAISVETTRKNARQYGVSYRQELKRLVVHGVLHLLGYKHGRKMSYAAQTYEKC